MAQPPAGVDHVFSAVLALFANVFVYDDVQKDGRIRDKSWQVAKKLLLKNLGTFMQNMINFKGKVDAESVPAVNWKEVKPYLQMQHFNVEVIQKRNSAAGGLCAWVRNIVSYNDTLLATKPLRVSCCTRKHLFHKSNFSNIICCVCICSKQVALDAANEAMEEANYKLKIATEEATRQKDELALLTDQFNQAEAERQRAITQARMTKI